MSLRRRRRRGPGSSADTLTPARSRSAIERSPALIAGRARILAVHGLFEDIKEGNNCYEDPHPSIGRFDFVRANPPFNVDKITKAELTDERFPRLPKADNGNYIWIQMFTSALAPSGRGEAGGPRADRVQFIDAREIYNQVDRAHRDFTDEQLEFLANIIGLCMLYGSRRRARVHRRCQRAI